MTLTLVHLSDLHYVPESPESFDLVLHECASDIQTEIGDCENPFLVFSGDFVRAGCKPAHYGALHKTLDERFSEINLPQERRIVVPGNHDVDRISLEPRLFAHSQTLRAIYNEKTFLSQLSGLREMFLDPGFTHYRAFEKSFATYHCCQETTTGKGWEITNSVGVFCLNTALCSSGGLQTSTGEVLSDYGHLHIDTRTLHAWLTDSFHSKRILVMHHPISWLAEWAQHELRNIIANNFDLVLSGHQHVSDAELCTRSSGTAIQVTAPALFTTKSASLGYAVFRLDDVANKLEVQYRQWTQSHTFVSGSSLSGTDDGKLRFSLLPADSDTSSPDTPARSNPPTEDILNSELQLALRAYNARECNWIDRTLSKSPELSHRNQGVVELSPTDLISPLRSCIIRAPHEHGLTSLGHYLSLQHWKRASIARLLPVFDSDELPRHHQALKSSIQTRMKELCPSATNADLAGIILDNWTASQIGLRIVREINIAFPGITLILLNGCNETTSFTSNTGSELPAFENYHLWALTRSQIRALTTSRLPTDLEYNDDELTNRIVTDIDSINAYRTPTNCLLFLKTVEYAYDDSPINRTELIGRVLYILFSGYDEIPRHATRPDLKDCEYAVGYLCEHLIRNATQEFSKQLFYKIVGEHCEKQVLDLDYDILFAFLVSVGIISGHKSTYRFRLTFWLYYFTAHRMHHSAEFAEYIFEDHRYADYPVVVEFYTGIDRRRTNAVEHLAKDLRLLNDQFTERSGIAEDFDPLGLIGWSPSEEAIQRMHEAVEAGAKETTLSKPVRDAFADRGFDRARPYDQEIRQFMDDASLGQLVQAASGAARALRNSDYVDPDKKQQLLHEVMRAWRRTTQVLFLVAPLLAKNRTASYDNMSFCLENPPADDADPDELSLQILIASADNIVNWFESDLYSRKLGRLLSQYAQDCETDLEKLFVMLLMVSRRPPGWDAAIERFIADAKRDSIGLHRVYSRMLREVRHGFVDERAIQKIRKLSATSLAKHSTTAKRPNKKLIKEAMKEIDKRESKSN